MMKIDTNQIAQMSREEKLLMMEAIWADLSRKDSNVDSPDWHKTTLDETQDRLVAGDEKLMDWEDAKRELRKPFD